MTCRLTPGAAMTVSLLSPSQLSRPDGKPIMLILIFHETKQLTSDCGQKYNFFNSASWKINNQYVLVFFFYKIIDSGKTLTVTCRLSAPPDTFQLSTRGNSNSGRMRRRRENVLDCSWHALNTPLEFQWPQGRQCRPCGSRARGIHGSCDRLTWKPILLTC